MSGIDEFTGNGSLAGNLLATGALEDLMPERTATRPSRPGLVAMLVGSIVALLVLLVLLFVFFWGSAAETGESPAGRGPEPGSIERPVELVHGLHART